jgi:esterase/lipase
MSNEYLQAAQDAKRLLSGFAAVATVAAAFEKVGSLQQAQDEAENALAILQGQIAAAKDELAAAGVSLAGVNDAALTATAEAKSTAEHIVFVAQQAADGIVMQAKQFADEAATASEARLAAIQYEVQEAETIRSAITREADLAQAKLDAIQAAIKLITG